MAFLFEKKERVAYMTFNRPEAMNALDPEALSEFSQACIDFRDDPDLWVAIVTGAGDKAFCGGADLKKLTPRITDGTFEVPPSIMRGLDIWKPFIAAVNGLALGGGFEVMLDCDLRIASENAVFGLPEVRWGFIAGWGGVTKLPRMIPRAKANEIIMTARTIDAQEAYRLGLINLVVPQSELMATAEKWAEEILSLAPLAVRAAKEIATKTAGLSLEDAWEVQDTIRNLLLLSQDVREGQRAFSEKRQPNFRGV